MSKICRMPSVCCRTMRLRITIGSADPTNGDRPDGQRNLKPDWESWLAGLADSGIGDKGHDGLAAAGGLVTCDRVIDGTADDFADRRFARRQRQIKPHASRKNVGD